MHTPQLKTPAMKTNKKQMGAQDPVTVFDDVATAHFKNRAAANIANHNFLFNWAFSNITERLELVKRDFPKALLAGARQSPDLVDKLCEKKNIEQLHILDSAEKLLALQNRPVICGHEEHLPAAANSLDICISNLALHSINDVTGVLIQIKNALKPDGLFIAAMFGGDTLTELRETLARAELAHSNGLSPRIFPFADKQQIGSLMQRAGFALPVVDSDKITVTYDNMFKLIEDIRGMGENNAINARDKKPLPRSVLMQAAELYQEQFSEKDGRIYATFEIIFLLGWAPHKNQQQPLRPGSAEGRLADALETDEIKAGEKTNA